MIIVQVSVINTDDLTSQKGLAFKVTQEMTEREFQNHLDWLLESANFEVREKMNFPFKK